MKKYFELEDLECANCAAKMEDKIKQIDGVFDASVSFFEQRLMIDADEQSFDKILTQAQKIINSIEPDCSIKL